MKRRLLLILLLLAGGAIVNVAVALGAVRLNHRTDWTSPREASARAHRLWSQAFPGSEFAAPLDADGDSITMWPGSHWDGTNSYLLEESIGSYFGFRYRRILDQLRAHASDVGQPLMEVIEAGWPMASLVKTAVDDPRDASIRYRGLFVRGRWPLPRDLLWPGFAINTVFYAVILWLLFAGPFALRRQRRIRRGLCPKCAYPVGTSEVCTECGAAVTSINSRAR